VGLNVDEVSSNSEENQDPRPRLTKMGFPFETGRGDRVLLDTLDAFQRATLDRWRPLPVPTSVLVDERGRVAVIYRGPVEVAQLLADVKLLKASPEALREAAVPFAGQWFDPVPVANPGTVSAQFIDLSMIGHAYRYLLGYAEQFAGLELSPGERRRVGDAYFTAAVLLKENSAFARAAETLQKGVAANPDDLRIRALLGELQWRQGNLDEAALHYGVVVKAMPSDFMTLRKLALVYLKQKKYGAALPLLERVTRAQSGNAVAHVNTASAWLGLKDYGKAVASYRATLKTAPRMPKALNNLAWILATHPDPKIRSGAEAVTVAERLCELSKYTSPVSLDTLATAYAEAGRFAEARATSEKAIGLLPPSADAVQAGDMKRRLELYKQEKPYRDQ
jgi:tetratricopeptide (TPR) repeat protein